ncbi:MAG: MoaD/ThiS family protein [Pirellulales bacterium]
MRIRLFAVARELAGAETLELNVAEPYTLAQLRTALAAAVPALAPILPHVLFAVGSDYIRDNTLLTEDTEVACIPPVSGG